MRVLLAIDGSPFSDAAVREVGLRPWPPATQVKLVTVDRPLGAAVCGTTPSGAVYDDIVRHERQQASQMLNQSAALLQQLARDMEISTALLEGVPKEQILNEAHRWSADLIVVGSQGRGAIRSLVLGSVSLAVATTAPCSVLIVRPRPAASSAGAPA